MILDEVRMFRKLGGGRHCDRNFESGRNFEYGADEGSCGRSGDMGITLHRAFDVCRDPYEAMEQCISLGIDTILQADRKALPGRDVIDQGSGEEKCRQDRDSGGGRYQSGEYRKTGSLHKCEGIPYVRESRD